MVWLNIIGVIARKRYIREEIFENGSVKFYYLIRVGSVSFFFPLLCESSTTHDPGIHPSLLEMQFHKAVLKAFGFSCASLFLSPLFFSSLRSELKVLGTHGLDWGVIYVKPILNSCS